MSFLRNSFQKETLAGSILLENTEFEFLRKISVKDVIRQKPHSLSPRQSVDLLTFMYFDDSTISERGILFLASPLSSEHCVHINYL